MKSNAALRVVENNSHSSKEFTIQASGKMFHMVISGLYSNKPQSITREIWSNAYDAHAMVGKKDVPFEVTFPTSLMPTFSCRDFGPGIAHEDMEGFYTVLGHSTKENTNMAVGKWGVGRMSPMSYTDTFSVVSRHKGMVAYYSIQLGPDGSPQLHVLAPPTKTDEPDGLEVSFPVKREDIRAFQAAAEVVSYGFDVLPKATNSKDKLFTPIEKVLEGEDFYLYQDSRMSGPYAQMGCVLYPIPTDKVGHRRNIVYKFDIGDLEVTASREALSFGPMDPTAKSITTKVNAVEASLQKLMQDKIDAEPNLFRAGRLLQALRRQDPYLRKTFTYKGTIIPTMYRFDLKNISVYAGYKGYNKKVGRGTNSEVSFSDDYTIYVEDTSNKKGCVRVSSRIGKDLQNYSHYFWIITNLSDPLQKSEVDSLIDTTGFPVKYVKDLPDDGPTTKKRGKIQAKSLDGTVFEMDDATFQKGGYYYPMSNNDYPYVLRYAEGLLKLQLKEPLALVPKTLWKKFEGNSEWKLLYPEFEAIVKKEADNAKKTLSDDYQKWPYNNFLCLKGKVDADSLVGKFVAKVEATRVHSYLDTNEYQWTHILEHFKLGGLTDLQAKIDYKKLLDKYPLLALIAENRNYADSWADYINLIDKRSKE